MVKRIPFFPEKKEIRNLCDRLTKNRAVKTKSTTAREFSQYKEVRYLREKDLVFIGKDHRKDVSIIFINKLIRKKGNGFVF